MRIPSLFQQEAFEVSYGAPTRTGPALVPRQDFSDNYVQEESPAGTVAAFYEAQRQESSHG